MRYVFILNPTAGKKNAYYSIFPSIQKYFDANGLECVCHITKKPMHALELANMEGAKGDPVRIYAIGGDGTLSETAAGAMGKNHVEIGIIPCGSGNDYIKTFGKVESFLSIESQMSAPSHSVDMIRSGEQYSINLCSIGLDAKVGYNMSHFKKIPFVSGSMAYNFAMIKTLFGKIGDQLEITIDDDKKYEGNYVFALAGSGKYYGGGFCGAPQAIPDDGLLDFILIKKPPLRQIPALIPIYKSGGHIDSKRFKDILTFCRGKKMEVKALRPAIANLDGECHIIDKIDFEVVPNCVRFIVPA